MNKPNILFLMTDHLRADIFREGSVCNAPFMQSLAGRGVRFDRAYTPNAICSPARASLMTGLLPHNHGVLTVTHCVDDDQACLREKYPHWAQSLKDAGYATGYFGKWHVERSGDSGEGLERFGWEESLTRYSNCAGGATFEQEYRLDNAGYPNSRFYGIFDVKTEDRPMGTITASAREYLGRKLQEDDPWCCFVSVPEPHDPYYCSRESFEKVPLKDIKLPENYADTMNDKPGVYRKAQKVFAGMSEEEVRMAIACYYGCVHEIDNCFSSVVDMVREAGKLDNTIVVLCTDHGDCLGEHGLFCKNIGAFEGVYNIPMIVAGPGVAVGVVSDARVGTHDLAQTLLELAGVDLLDNSDSRSFAAECTKPGSTLADWRTGYAEFFGTRMPMGQRVVYKDQWKFVHNAFDYDELYDLENDPLEMTNLAQDAAYADTVKDMCSVMWDYVKRTGDATLLNTHYPPLRLAPVGPES